MARDTRKTIRMDGEVAALLAALRPHFPQFTDETKLIDHLIRTHALHMATRATRPGLPRYAGYDPQDLVAQLGPEVLALMNFMLEHGWRPPLLQHAFATPDPLPAPAPDPAALISVPPVAPTLAVGYGEDGQQLGADWGDED